MLLYLRQACPDAKVVTSTNGIPLAKPERAKKVVQSGIDMIFFTIGGITQESYVKYHVAGKVELALKGMKNVLDARAETGAARPVVVWRYLLFRWNDSLDEVDEAIRMAEQYGVDVFHLYLTHVPHGAWSFRFAPGTPNFVKYRKYIECALDYTRLVGLIEPDADGFFWEEDVAELGRARWTGYRATMACNARNGWMTLAFATTHDAARERPTVVFVQTPWKVFKVTLDHMTWRPLTIRVPSAFRSKPVSVSISTPHYWFPSVELGTADTRCLGVLVRVEAETKPAGGLRRWWDASATTPLTEHDLAMLADLDVGTASTPPLHDLSLGGRMNEGD